MTKDTSIPAFPSMPSVIYDEAGKATTFPGMTLRQWYAGMALQGLVAAIETTATTVGSNKGAAEYCFNLADAMLAASEQEQKP